MKGLKEFTGGMVMKKSRKVKVITAEELDEKFERGEDITPWLDLKNAKLYPAGSYELPKKAVVPQKINVDFPEWMVKRLDQEAAKLNISRQAVIKTWVRDRLDPHHRISL
jgi:hypothetical protein